MIRTRLSLAIAALLLVVACSPEDEVATPMPTVPDSPDVLHALIEHHADQFDTDLKERPAGSQQELAAATYITGHLQLAGYTIRLDDVPVGDLVESSNILALPPSGEDPEIVVTVPYDSDGRHAYGRAIGMFLEVARALNRRSPEHAVEFVALGAELTARPGSTNGSAELARSLEGRDLDVDVYKITEISGNVIIDGPRVMLEGEVAEAGRGLLDLLSRPGG